ncbi:MAG: amino acid decarboxylase [Oscillospiraceae bacterium]|nr:amino acid decarboxylase [Oscillospiraceae bacterium]
MTDFSMLRQLDEYKKLARSSFHMPGHKGNKEKLGQLFDLLRYDFTELPETGSLFDGEGLTAQAEAAATRFFGTKGTFFSAEGCTLPIQAMLRLALPEGGKLLCGRTVHRAAVNAMALLGITPVWLLPDDSAGAAFSGRIVPGDVRAALEKGSAIGAVYLTSPDYFGVMSDIAAIAAVCKEFSVPLLVDNAHGAHLKSISPALHPIDCGAAMCSDSAHKTLPVLTGGAFLHVMEEKFLPHVRTAMALFGSTSPSYPILASLDLCRQWLAQEGMKAFALLREQTAQIKTTLLERGFSVPSGAVDPVRICAYTPSAGISAAALSERLRKQGIEPEYAAAAHIILIPSPFNTAEDFGGLNTALRSCPCSPAQKSGPLSLPAALPGQVLTPREALLAKSEILPAKTAFGRVSAETACLCPPGIPIVAPGERIDGAVLENLRLNGIKNIKVVK